MKKVSTVINSILIVTVLNVLGASCSVTHTPSQNTNVERSIIVNESTTTNVPTIDVKQRSNGFVPTPDTMEGTNVLPKRVTVSISSREFSPKVVLIAVGGTVTWINSDSVAHQPASDPHPSHSAVPGFDARSGLLTGESFQFTFAKAGTFGYHDHLNAALVGTIVVR